MKFLGKLVLNAVVVGMMLPMPVLLASEQESKESAAKEETSSRTPLESPLSLTSGQEKEKNTKRRYATDEEIKKVRDEQASSILVPISSRDNPLQPRDKSVLDVYQDGLMAYSKVSAWGFGSRMGAVAKRDRLQEISKKLLPHKNDSDIAELLTMLDKDIKEMDKILQDMEREEKEKEARLTEAQQIVAQYGQVESKRSAAAAQPTKTETSEKPGLLETPEISISQPHSWRRNIVFASIFAVAAVIGAWFWFSRSKVS